MLFSLTLLLGFIRRMYGAFIISFHSFHCFQKCLPAGSDSRLIIFVMINFTFLVELMVTGAELIRINQVVFMFLCCLSLS
jgi:hypothetical protein